MILKMNIYPTRPTPPKHFGVLGEFVATHPGPAAAFHHSEESEFDGDLFPYLHPYLTTCRDLLAAHLGTRLDDEGKRGCLDDTLNFLGGCWGLRKNDQK